MDHESRIKVGIFFNARVSQGGLYQYALTLVHCLHAYEPQFDYSLYLATLEDFPLEINSQNWKVFTFSKPSIYWHFFWEVLLNYISKMGARPKNKLIPQYREMKRDQPDIVVYVKPSPQVFQWDYPSIFPIHDLQHRLQSHFPEVSDKGEFNRREFLYKNSVSKARAILSDSQTGKEDIIQLYHVDEDKIYPLPYIEPPYRHFETNTNDYAEIERKYSLPGEFLFYPATFWPHKNHARLIKAIRRIADEKGVLIPLVLTGGKTFEFPGIEKLIDDLSLQDTIKIIGYISDSELLQIYRHSLALVMPTFFGPTNIPVIEAWGAGCPVITSDIRGIREQVGDAGILVDPEKVEDIANGIWQVYSDRELRSKLAANGKRKIEKWTPEAFAHSLASIIDRSSRKIIENQ